ncbi:helix-turn-helix domain-containing protein [Enterococcus casseliflavus]|uniref:helix-turn-helix domain-containing protein n=1 Tax=Enterococcus casseliflavus TaxID=37734 RepID=UPI003D1508BB
MRELQLNFMLNKTTVRWLQMLNTFERERTCSIASLANKLDVTQRTISSDIKELKTYLQEAAEFTLEANGYHFRETDPKRYLSQKKELVAEEGMYQIVEAIFHGEFCSVEEWAQRLYVSESTMRRYLNTASATLRKYHLEWILQPVNLSGSEANIRKFFKDFYYESDVTPHTLLPPKELIALVSDAFSKIPTALVNTGVSPSDFYYSLYIAIKRYQLGKTVQIPRSLAAIVETHEAFAVMKNLAPKIEALYRVRLPQQEMMWLYLVTVMKRTLTEPEKEQQFVAAFGLYPELEELSQRFVQEWGISFQEPQQVQTMIHAFFLSKKINEQLAPVLNHLLTEVKTEAQKHGSAAYQKNLAFMKQHQAILGFKQEYLSDICAALTLYSEAIRELYAQKVKRIALIIEGDLYACHTIRGRFLRYVGNDHRVFFPKINELTSDYLKEKAIDLVVTNYSEYLSEFILSTDSLLLKAIPDHQDWLRVIEKIDPQLGQALSVPTT